MRYELKSIGIWSVLKVSFFINLLVGFLYGLVNAIVFGLIMAVAPGLPFGELSAELSGASFAFTLIVFPFIGAIGGAIFLTLFCVVFCAIYNLLVKLIGGYEFELETVESMRPDSLQVSTATEHASSARPVPPPPPPRPTDPGPPPPPFSESADPEAPLPGPLPPPPEDSPRRPIVPGEQSNHSDNDKPAL